MATPYYNAFEGDHMDRSEVELVGVQIEDGEHGELAEVRRLEQEMQRRAEEGGAKVRAVLITNPHNPLGEFSTAKRRCIAADLYSAQASAIGRRRCSSTVASLKSGIYS